jgi:hypothetical protein
LSGPFSFRYLSPPRPELPLVILFGDRHGKGKLCDPCDEEKGCMSVFEPPFMQMIDELARDVPVDFFLENTWDWTEKKSPSHILFSRMNGATKNCYDVAKRSHSSYHPACPTQFVRWHYAETRFSTRYMQEKAFIEPALMAFQNYLFYMYTKQLDDHTVYENYNYFQTVPEREIWQGADTEFANTILELLFSKLTDKEIIEKMVETLFFYINAYPSMIRKQLEKHRKQEENRQKQLHPPVPLRLDDSSLKKALVTVLKKDSTSFYDYFLGFRKALEDPVVTRELYDAFQSMLITTGEWEVPKFFDTPDQRRTLTYVLMLLCATFRGFTARLLELYAVARMVKLPENSDRGILHIGYYGDGHSRGLSSMLTEILDYTVISEISQPIKISEDEVHVNGCIKFDKPIYLEADVRDLARRRYETFYKEDRELLDKYKRTIGRELMGRTASSSASSSSSSSSSSVTRRSRTPTSMNDQTTLAKIADFVKKYNPFQFELPFQMQ